jgi:hypothetical protein
MLVVLGGFRGMTGCGLRALRNKSSLGSWTFISAVSEAKWFADRKLPKSPSFASIAPGFNPIALYRPSMLTTKMLEPQFKAKHIDKLRVIKRGLRARERGAARDESGDLHHVP